MVRWVVIGVLKPVRTAEKELKIFVALLLDRSYLRDVMSNTAPQTKAVAGVRDHVERLQCMVGKKLTINGVTADIIKVDAFGPTPHFGLFGQAPDGNYWSGWIACALVTMGDIKD